MISALENVDKIYVKEACCRMIIKYFGKVKGKGGGDGNVDQEKIEFIKLIEPLFQMIYK